MNGMEWIFLSLTTICQICFFPVAKLTVNRLRCAVSTEHVNMLVTMHCNTDLMQAWLVQTDVYGPTIMDLWWSNFQSLCVCVQFSSVSCALLEIRYVTYTYMFLFLTVYFFFLLSAVTFNVETSDYLNTSINIQNSLHKG